MEGEEQNENVAHEFDPEMALAAAAAKAELEAEKEGEEEVVVEEIHEEEIIISNEGDDENEEKEGEEKTILRARKKNRNYVNYNANNYNNTNYSNNKNTNYSNNKNTNYSNNKNTNYSNNKNTNYSNNKNTNYTNNKNTNYSNNKNTNNTNNKNNTTTKIITTTKKTVVKKKDLIYDPNYDAQSNYFYQKLSDNDWIKIKAFLNKAFTEEVPTEIQLKNFFDEYPKIKKGNIDKLQEALDNIASEKKNFNVYQKIMQFFLKEFYKPKPSICEVYFFPNSKNEKFLIEMIRTCMKSLNVAIFSLTRDNFAKAIIEVFKKGVKVRVIADDECVKNYGSDVYKLAAAGIPCKTDSSAQFHMHNKYAIIDESVIVTGSFNWTSQAINNNQENLLFYEDKDIAEKYTKEFNKLWDSFSAVIDKETALKQIEIEKNKPKPNFNNTQK